MKRFLLFVFTLVFFAGITGCQKERGYYRKLEPQVPREANQLGQMFADQINYVFKQLKKNNVDYSNPDELLAGIEKYAVEIANKTYPDNPTSIEEVRTEMSKMYDNVYMTLDGLTSGQMEYLYAVSAAQVESKTTREFFVRLNEINNTVIPNLPLIEQRRLFNASSVLYHMYNEATMLVNEGYIPFKNSTPQHIRTRFVEDEFEYFTVEVDLSECPDETETRSLLYSVPYTRSGATIYVTVMASVICSVVGSTIVAAISPAIPVIAFIVAVSCLTGDTQRLTEEQCAEKRNDCNEYNKSWSESNSGSVWGESMCTSCYKYCVGTGKWDCPRPKTY